MPRLELKGITKSFKDCSRARWRLARGRGRRDRGHLRPLRHRQDGTAAADRRRTRSRSRRHLRRRPATWRMWRRSSAASAWRSRTSRSSRICRRSTTSPARWQRAIYRADCDHAKGSSSVAKLLKIDHVLGHTPRELSNGQKQRTALARALVAVRRSCSCSTIPCAMSMPSCASRCGWSCRACCASPARRCST